ncbi:MAG: hypothetical protein IPJ84_01640 [Bdellovibrionales bacterium]|nr:hypothetical protein [Bdellovibrionales bacterium]
MKDDEVVAVFIKKKRCFDTNKKSVNAAVFLPKPYKGRDETSVFSIHRLLESQIWREGHLWTVVNPFPRGSGKDAILARAEITSAIVKSSVSSLSVESDPNPNPRHHVIVGWGGDEATQELAALTLAVQSTLKIRPK